MYYSKKWEVARLRIGFIIGVFFLSLGVSTAWSDEEATAARAIMSKWQDVVITVKVITKLRVIVEGTETYKSENETETIATLIDPTGLSVLSFSSIDPAIIYDELLRKAKSGGEGTPKFNIESDISDIKMILSEGQEVSAKLVMRDRDLDLAFVRPAEKLTKPIPALDLSRNVKPDIQDTIAILTRLGRTAGHAPSISIYRIEAVLKKPRTFYVIDQNAFIGKLSAPVFSLDGKIAGILLLRITKSEGKSIGMSNLLSGMGSLGIMPVILPAGEIAAVAKQALEVKDK